MFKQHDCPYIRHGASVWCKLKAHKIINDTSLSFKEKFARLHKQTCSGCQIYKEAKND